MFSGRNLNSEDEIKKELREFFYNQQNPPKETTENDLIVQIKKSWERFESYQKDKKFNSRYRSHSYLGTGHHRTITKLSQQLELLMKTLNSVDQMLEDEISERLKYDYQKDFSSTEMKYLLRTFQTTIEALKQGPKKNISQGRPKDEILYQWILEMAEIYLAWTGRNPTHRKKDPLPFYNFISRFRPKSLTNETRNLAPHTIQRILQSRSIKSGWNA